MQPGAQTTDTLPCVHVKRMIPALLQDMVKGMGAV